MRDEKGKQLLSSHWILYGVLKKAYSLQIQLSKSIDKQYILRSFNDVRKENNNNSEKLIKNVITFVITFWRIYGVGKWYFLWYLTLMKIWARKINMNPLESMARKIRDFIIICTFYCLINPPSRELKWNIHYFYLRSVLQIVFLIWIQKTFSYRDWNCVS